MGLADQSEVSTDGIAGFDTEPARSIAAWLHRRFPVFAVSTAAAGYEYVSDRTAAVLGYGIDDLRGSLVDDLVHPEDYLGLLGAVDPDGPRSWEARLRLRHRTDGWVWFDGHLLRLDDEPFDSPTARWVSVAEPASDDLRAALDIATAAQLDIMQAVNARAVEQLDDIARLLELAHTAAESESAAMMADGIAELRRVRTNLDAVSEMPTQVVTGATDLAEELPDLDDLLSGLVGPKVRLRIEVDDADLFVAASRPMVVQLLAHLALVAGTARPERQQRANLRASLVVGDPSAIGRVSLPDVVRLEFDVSGVAIAPPAVESAMTTFAGGELKHGEPLSVLAMLVRTLNGSLNITSVERVGTRVEVEFGRPDWRAGVERSPTSTS